MDPKKKGRWEYLAGSIRPNPFRLLGLLAGLFLISACGRATSPTSLPTLRPSLTAEVSTPTFLSSTTKVSISPGKEIEGNFIALFPGEDADTQVIEACQTSGLRSTGNGQTLPADSSNEVEDYYMQFDVDNRVMFNGHPTNRVQLDIEYCDRGTDSFGVEYDGLSGGPFGDGQFLASELVHKTGSGQIRTVSFTFDDARFSNRDNGADFRISDMSDGAETVLSVTITLLPADASGNLTPTALPSRSAAAVDATTLNDKVIFGYQGWFGCPNDGSLVNAWFHWFEGGSLASNLTVDLWPDTSELGVNELCPTKMNLADGSPLMAYSAFNETTVMRHFQWMEDYGIDGVALQRFVGEIQGPRFYHFRNQVARSVRLGAESYGRVFYIEYDVTGASPSHLRDYIQKDWEFLVDVLHLTESPQYLHENGMPVVEVWGLGVIGSSEATAGQAKSVIDYFHTDADPQYRAYVIGGVASYWRAWAHEVQGTDWDAIYRSFDMISPWAVGNYGRNSEADDYLNQVIKPDLQETQNLGIGYMPVIFPGFSWANLFPGEPSNFIPRRCGEFYWHQAYNAIKAGARTIFVAMFDEVDEGTAMFKLVPTADQLPAGTNLLPLDVDGCALPSDWYLQLGGLTGKMLRGEIPLSAEMPITPQ